VAAPFDRDWASGYTKPANGYNSVHLSPRFFSHFFSWWSLFSGVMSLPIRQGNLWSGPAKTSKKFGRHLATIKYNLLLSPLFLAHVYKHKDAEDYAEDTVSATGLKIRLDSFVLDLHQRREYFDTQAKGKSKQTRTSAMRINQAELDFLSADVRAVSANIGGTTVDDLLRASDEALASYQDPAPAVDMSQFTIPDQDLSWIDMDDFVELDWILPAESNPETKILPLAFTPRFTYFRQTDHGDSVHGDQSRVSPFGDEPTHYCVMSHLNDPRKVQMQLVRARLESLEEQIELQQRLMSEQELRVVRDGDQDQALKEAYDNMVAQDVELHHKKRFLENGLRRLAGPLPDEQVFGRHGAGAQASTTESGSASGVDTLSTHPDIDGLFPSPQDEFASDFNNRFIVHNIQLKWNNALRNIILRYSHQVSQRRGFVYYMSRRAVKFIIDIVEEQAKSKTKEKQYKQAEQPKSFTSTIGSPSDEKDEDTVVEDRINQLLSDAKRFVDVEDLAESEAQSLQRETTAEVREQVAEDFVALNSYHIRLIAPQIQLQSEKNTHSVVLVAAKGMEFKVISIMDRGNLSDDVSGLVQRRFALDMDGAQFFVTTQKTLYKFLHLYSGNKYGNAPGSSWPPWVSLEVMFDFHLNPFGFQRIIQKTSASLRYEKYNPLRLKHEKVESGENTSAQGLDQQQSRLDQLWIDFPRVRASCDSTQYYAMYVIVMDLLLYSEPLEKTRSERLDRIMLASDFSDLRGAPEIATSLQERIRQLEEIKNHFQINAKYLDRDGWQDRIKLEEDLSTCENELFFIMKAIITSQQKNDDRKSSKATCIHRWYLSASEIVWHLMRDKNEPLLEFQLGNAAYERIDNRDGSNHNAMEIQHIRGLNLLPYALYPDIIGRYQDPDQDSKPTGQDHTMLQVHWYMLEAIAGIPVLEEFQVKVFPLKVQLERDLGKKLFEYIFPGVGSNPEGGVLSPMNVKNMKPVEAEEDSEAEEAASALSPDLSNGSASQEDFHGIDIGALGRRLKPTLALHHHDRLPQSNSGTNMRGKGLGLSIFKHPNPSISSRATGDRPASRKSSYDNLQIAKKNADRVNEQHNTAHRSKLGINRPSSKDRRGKAKKGDKDKPSDDLSMMMSRASNYMTLAHVKLESFVICLSYKGKGDHNIEDLYDFVFRMPTLEYGNKIWSNLDLALRLKKDFIKALISHTGAILGNKFTHHRANKQQQNRLREIAASSAILPNSDTLINTPGTSETASLYSNTNYERSDLDLPRGSFSAGNGQSTPLIRSNSFSSSIHSATPSTFREAGVPPPGEPIGTLRSTVSKAFSL
jgi:hypothetical protein